MANIEDFLNSDFKSQEYPTTMSKLIADYAMSMSKMSVYLEQILFRQIELKMLVQDSTIPQEAIDEKIQDTFDKLKELVNQDFHNRIANLTK